MALTKAVKGELRFELLGVKAVRAFDANVVIVSMALPDENAGQRLVGCFLTPDADPSRGAALAVLNATNRILGNRFFMRLPIITSLLLHAMTQGARITLCLSQVIAMKDLHCLTTLAILVNPSPE